MTRALVGDVGMTVGDKVGEIALGMVGVWDPKRQVVVCFYRHGPDSCQKDASRACEAGRSWESGVCGLWEPESAVGVAEVRLI